MKYSLKFKDIDEIREFEKENFTIRDVLNELGLSAQTIVAKQNGELTIEDSLINDGDEININSETLKGAIALDDHHLNGSSLFFSAPGGCFYSEQIF